MQSGRAPAREKKNRRGEEKDVGAELMRQQQQQRLQGRECLSVQVMRSRMFELAMLQEKRKMRPVENV